MVAPMGPCLIEFGERGREKERGGGIDRTAVSVWVIPDSGIPSDIIK